jgi:pentatricopeptide repeat protein
MLRQYLAHLPRLALSRRSHQLLVQVARPSCSTNRIGTSTSLSFSTEDKSTYRESLWKSVGHLCMKGKCEEAVSVLNELNMSTPASTTSSVAEIAEITAETAASVEGGLFVSKDQRTNCLELIEACMERNLYQSAFILYRDVVVPLSSTHALRQQTQRLICQFVDHLNQPREAFELLLLTYEDDGWNKWPLSHQARVDMYHKILKSSLEMEKDFQLSQEVFSAMEERGDAKMLSAKEMVDINSLMLRILFLAGAPSSAQDLYTRLAARGMLKCSNSSRMYVTMIRGLARCGQLEQAAALFRDAVAEVEKLSEAAEAGQGRSRFSGKSSLHHFDQIVRDDDSKFRAKRGQGRHNGNSNGGGETRFMYVDGEETLDEEENELLSDMMFDHNNSGVSSSSNSPSFFSSVFSSITSFGGTSRGDKTMNSASGVAASGVAASSGVAAVNGDDNDSLGDNVAARNNQHDMYKGHTKFLLLDNKNKHGFVTLKNGEDVYFHVDRSFNFESQDSKQRVEQFATPGLPVNFRVEDVPRGKEARELQLGEIIINDKKSCHFGQTAKILRTVKVNKNQAHNMIAVELDDNADSKVFHAKYLVDAEDFAAAEEMRREIQGERDQFQYQSHWNVSLRETYHAMIETYARFHQIEEAQWLFEEMKSQEHLRPDIRTYDVMIHGYSTVALLHSQKKDSLNNHDINPWLEHAKNIFYEITQQGISDQNLYGTMISVLVDHNQVQEAEELYSEIISLGFESSNLMITSLIHGNGKIQNVERAVQLFDRFILQMETQKASINIGNQVGNKTNLSEAQLTTRLYHSMLKAYLDNYMIPDGLALLERMRTNNVSLNFNTYEIVVDGLCTGAMKYHKNDGRAKKWSRLAYEMYQKTPSLRNNKYLSNRLLQSLCHVCLPTSGRPSQSWRLYSSSDETENGWRSQAAHAALKLYQEMQYRGLPLYDINAAALITLLSKQKQLNEALMLYKSTVPQLNHNDQTVGKQNELLNPSMNGSPFSDLPTMESDSNATVSTPRTPIVYQAILESLSRFEQTKSFRVIHDEMRHLNIHEDARTDRIILHRLLKGDNILDKEEEEEGGKGKEAHQEHLHDEISKIVHRLLDDNYSQKNSLKLTKPDFFSILAYFVKFVKLERTDEGYETLRKVWDQTPDWKRNPEHNVLFNIVTKILRLRHEHARQRISNPQFRVKDENRYR